MTFLLNKKMHGSRALVMGVAVGPASVLAETTVGGGVVAATAARPGAAGVAAGGGAVGGNRVLYNSLVSTKNVG